MMEYQTPTARRYGLGMAPANVLMHIARAQLRPGGDTPLNRSYAQSARPLIAAGLVDWGYAIGHSGQRLYSLTDEGKRVVAAIRAELDSVPS